MDPFETLSEEAPTMRARPAPRTRSTGPDSRQAPGTDLQALMQAVQQRCPQSFATLYRVTQRRLFGIVLTINKDRAESEDVLQEVYFRVWNNSAQFNANKGPADLWLGSIAHHAALDSLRRRRARPVQVLLSSGAQGDDDDLYAELPCPSPQPADHLMRQQAAQAVRACLEQLPASHRQSLSLALLEDMSHTEIAGRMDRPLGTVKSWLRRSVQTLRPMLLAHQ